ncbi:DUF58 domain-containing protein [Alkalihalobacterium bogoriense]|uniref:DUF58 domain-containing protein n=1 Tax=Alkalihalobacterium bogoriense TaxID=246272 RepID=UPI000A06870B|nr:DUF58 domain-containing protein [Alkalihalobacterium bogoriense]
MTKPSQNLLDRFLFRDKGIVPSKKLVIFLSVTAGIFLIGSFFGLSFVFILLLFIIVLLASLSDLLFSAKKGQLTFTRTIEEKIERGLSYRVSITIETMSSHWIKIELIDGLPQSFVRSFPIHGVLSSERTTVIYETIAPIRGDYTISYLFVRYESKLGLWKKQIKVPLEDKVKVIPDMTETKQYLESAQRYLLYEGSMKRKHRSGAGEFSKIRNYVVGDDPRLINWRQTAKLQEVMSNEYEPEHGKYITILVDCGRMMGSELKKGNRLEKALEAALTVTAAALNKGDYVAVIAFSKDVKVFVPPGKGMAHFQTILHAIYDVQVDAAESNYGEILRYLELVQKKRSFLLLFSDVSTFLHEESALHYLIRLRKRHLFLMIGVEDETLLERVADYPTTVQNAMVKTIAQQQWVVKKRGKAKWEKQGLHLVEAKEERLATVAVSSYINIINRGLL